jgi:hypothetical protein
MSTTPPTESETANWKRTEWGEYIDISKVSDLERNISLTICVGMGYPWWNFLSQAREIIRTVEEFGGTVVYSR